MQATYANIGTNPKCSYTSPPSPTEYDIKVYEEGEQCETIRNLTYVQMYAVVMMLRRFNIKHKVVEVK